MRSVLTKLQADVRASYWFIPLVLSILAAVLATSLVWIDSRMEWHGRVQTPLFFAVQPDGARSMLSAIGGSMIGVAGTVFSVTMAAVVYASGSYGPRVLTNFMTDRGNQFTLGTFTATFVYCILVLRTVRAGSAEGADLRIDEFVPVLATFGATILGLCSIGVLIYFIHHVPSNIHIANLVAGIGKSLMDGIADRFPRRLGEPSSDRSGAAGPSPAMPAAFAGGRASAAGEVEAGDTGYVQIIDEDDLLDVASRHDVVVRLNVRPGAFLHPDRIVFDVAPPERLDAELADELRGTLALGNQRTATQDLVFLLDELVEIAARALSPGVNDPYTAVNCIDWLGAALADLAGRVAPDAMRLDEAGNLRVVALPLSFPDYLKHGFGNLRPYAAADVIAARHMLLALGKVARSCRDRTHLDAVAAEGDDLMALVRENLSGPSLALLEASAAEFDEVLREPRHRSRLGAA